jgi:lipopolysaccharide export system permease protein
MIPSILSRYIARQFLLNFTFLLLILLGIIFLFDAIELLRRSADQSQMSLSIVLLMSFMKLPEVGQRLFPFAVLFAAMFTFWRLAKTSELVIFRATGLSVWQFLKPIMLCALGIGILTTTLVNPISAIFLSRFEVMEIKYLQKKNSLITISEEGLWLRQHEDVGYTLIHAAKFNPKTWVLDDLILFYFNESDDLKIRIDAKQPSLKQGYWDISQALVHGIDADNITDKTTPLPHYKIKTQLTSSKIEDSFAAPEIISFWDIPNFIHAMKETGFPTIKLKVHYQALLAQPFLFMAMILLAASVSLRPQRQGGTAIMVILGVGIGFFIFFIENILQAFGISQKIPIFLAAWSPSVISLLLGAATILYLEDG